MTNVIVKQDLVWTSYHEGVLIDWADKAKCYHWLHNKSQKKYKVLNNWFTIPVIILSTATGTANFAQYRVTDSEVKSYAPLVLGCVNIFTGIVTTVQQFLKINELNESHKISALGWDKLYRNIKIELSKHPDERENVKLITKAFKDELNRLLEMSPVIEDSIIKVFHNTFTQDYVTKWCCLKTKNTVTEEEKESFKKMKKPDICGSLQTTADFRHPRSETKSTQTFDCCECPPELKYIEYNVGSNNTENTSEQDDKNNIELDIV